MQHEDIKIEEYRDAFREQLLDVWEKSVLATHDFLKPDDFYSIRNIVHTIEFNLFDVYCLTHQHALLGFIGVTNKKVEMLFLSPDYFGQGLGKKLMCFAISELQADKVDVNEQNLSAVGFYKSMGFETDEWTDQDDQGNNYPLLRMKLKKA